VCVPCQSVQCMCMSSKPTTRISDESMLAFLDTPRLPKDAGKNAQALSAIIARIPSRWGRWISCDKGWFPLVINCDKELAILDPDYAVHQVKEKFGGLRYYFETSASADDCCAIWRRGSSAPEGDSDQAKARREAYHADYAIHRQSEECRASQAHRNARYAQMKRYEDLSLHTCELCGSPGDLRVGAGWYKTTCESCAGDGFIRVSD
jgi:hypothetical protein